MFTKQNLKLVGAFLLMCSAAPAVGAEGERSVRAPSVTVARVVVSEIIVRTPVTGTLVPFENVQVNTELNGLAVKEIMVEAGDVVAAGDVLLILDDRIQDAQVTQAEAESLRAEASKRQASSQVDTADANLAQAFAALERAKLLKNSGTISQANFDQSVAAEATARAALLSAQNGFSVAAAQIRVAGAQLELATLNLMRTHILAPSAGLVSQRNALVGAIASAGGAPLFVITKDGMIEIEVEVIETALGGITLGDATEFDVSGVGLVEGTVRLVAPTVDPGTRLGIVRVALKPQPNLRAGLFASGWIVLDTREALSVPVQAVLSDTTGEYVQIVVDDAIEHRAVVAGQLWQGQREILSGVAAGETVLARAGAFFRDGDHVTPVEGTK